MRQKQLHYQLSGIYVTLMYVSINANIGVLSGRLLSLEGDIHFFSFHWSGYKTTSSAMYILFSLPFSFVVHVEVAKVAFELLFLKVSFASAFAYFRNQT